MFYTHLHPIFKQTQVEARYVRKVWEFTYKGNWDHVYPSLWSGQWTINDQIGSNWKHDPG